MDTVKITKRIAKLSHLKGVSVNQMLKDCALNKSVVDNLKKGSMPSVDKIAKIADYFGVSTDYLLGRDENPKKAAQDEEYDIIETIGSEGEHRIRKVSKSQFDMIDTILKTMSQEQEEFEKKLPK